MNAIEANGLSKSYGPVVALKNVSFTVETGEVIGLLGPNGAGKTTLIKILTGYLQADEGSARICGTDVGEEPLTAQAKIGYLPENAPLYREMTVHEYLLMMATLRGVPDHRRTAYLTDAIEATGLEDYLARPIGHLSKGYRQRVGLAQALMHRPELLILDEPTSGLDPTQIADIRHLVKELSRRSTVMLCTHTLPEVEMTCQRVLIIMKGRLRTDDNLHDLRAVNAAVATIHKDADGVDGFLEKLSGVDSVELQGRVGDYNRWRVTSADDADLCPSLFDALRATDWRVAELRSATRTLESVFRELAEATREATS